MADDIREIGFENLTADMTTHSLVLIDHAHHEIHEGDHFIYTDSVQLSTDSQDYLLTTPASPVACHMLFDMDGSAITQFRLYEGADRTGTTDQVVGNSNRNSSTAATLTIHKGTSGGTTDGTLIQQYKGGASSQVSKSPTGTRNDAEIILKYATKYILRVTGFAAGTLCNVRLEWYEHTPLG